MTRNRFDLSRRLIAAATRTGGPAGRDAADWWAQDTIGGRAPAHRATDNARRILAGLDNGDPELYDTLPTPTPEQVIDAYTNHTPPIGPDWPNLPAADRDAFDDAYASAYTDAVHTRITRLCRLVLAPADQPQAAAAGLRVPDRDADWSHLHPDRLRVGRIGVFAGDWSYYAGTDGQMRIPVGFVGVLVDIWNGWAVFRCDRDVADAIVTEQQRIRGAERDRLAATGLTGNALDQVVDECVSGMFWDGDTIVTDNRARYGESDAFERTGPDEHGRYIVNGWDWTWTAVDPGDCDRIAGTLPTADAVVAFVPLVHRDGSVPHGRFTVTSDRGGYLLRLDAATVGRIHDVGYPTVGYTPLAGFDPATFDAHAAASRINGATPTPGQLLAALIAEHFDGRLVAYAEQTAAAAARLRGADGDVVTSVLVRPVPHGHQQFRDLAVELDRAHPHLAGEFWQIWCGPGRGWQFLGPSRGTSSTGEPPAIQGGAPGDAKSAGVEGGR